MTATQRIQEQLKEYLSLPESYPIIKVSDDMMNTLIRQAWKQKERRFTGEPITDFSPLLKD